MSLDFLLETNKEKPPTIENGYGLLDISQLAIATAVNSFSGTQAEKFSLNLMRHLILNTLKANVVKCRLEGYPNIIICADNTHNVGYWRRQFAYYYKKNRQKDRSQSKFDFEGFFEYFPIVLKEIAENMPYVLMYIDTLEADDIIGVLSKYFAVRNIPVRIVSSDGDFTQLQSLGNVTQYSPIQKKMVTPSSGSAKLDLITKIVKGDKKDCVSPIKTRSDFYLTKIEGEGNAPACKAAWVEEIANCETDDEIKKVLNNDELWKRFEENRVLIDLSYVPQDLQDKIIHTFTESKPGPKNQMYKYFVHSGLSKLLTEIHKF